MKKALIILHQKRSITGDIGNKLKSRGYILDIRRPCCGEALPINLDRHALVVILGGPISVNDDCEYKDYEITWLKVVLESGKPFAHASVSCDDLSVFSLSKYFKL